MTDFPVHWRSGNGTVCVLIPDFNFSYLRRENSTGRRVPPFYAPRIERSGGIFLSGTATWLSGTSCPALPIILLFNYVSIYDVKMQSAMFPAMSEGCLDIEKRKYSAYFLMKCLCPNVESRQTNLSLMWWDVWSQSQLPPWLVFMTYRITLDWDLSVLVKHWYSILLVLIAGYRILFI